MCCIYGLRHTSSKNDRDHKEYTFTYTCIYILCLQSVVPFHSSKCPHLCYVSHSRGVYYNITHLHPATYLAYKLYIILYAIMYMCLNKTKSRAEVYGIRTFVVCIMYSLHISCIEYCFHHLFQLLMKSEKEKNPVG